LTNESEEEEKQDKRVTNNASAAQIDIPRPPKRAKKTKK
jgi:hypothetical protein